MQIKLTSVFVDDQDRALKFYTEVLGFVKKYEFPAGQFKWLTVVSPGGRTTGAGAQQRLEYGREGLSTGDL